MKLTCICKGSGGYHFPASHMLELCGFQILLECPLDLSATAVFAPLPPPPLTGGRSAANNIGLIPAVPWYKTPASLHLWDPSLINAVLISTPTAMLGLPFLTRQRNFSAKIYTTEATATVGRLMMEELVSLHDEYIQLYGPDKKEGFPNWLKWEELEKLPPKIREILVGEDGVDLWSWMPLYSAEDVRQCMQCVQPLKYAEEACYNGTLLLTAFSSGLEIGSCNWTIKAPRRSISYLSCSIFKSMHAMDFDFFSLRGSDLIIFSDFSSFSSNIDDDMGVGGSINRNDVGFKDNSSKNISFSRSGSMKEEELYNCLLSIDESSEEENKINYISSWVINLVKEGKSALLPLGRVGILLLLIEHISKALDASTLQVPMFMISSAADEMLAFANIVPEWLCKRRQEKLFAGDSLFDHVKLLEEKNLRLFPALGSSQLLMAWREPCIVFCPHWTLRLGPAVQLWHVDKQRCVIVEKETNQLSLLPFKTFETEVLQCSFVSGIKLEYVPMLLSLLNPKIVLFPEDMRSQSSLLSDNPSQFLFYSESVKLRVPSSKAVYEVRLSSDLASSVLPRKVNEHMAIARVKSQLLLKDGEYHLVPPGKPLNNSHSQLLHWGACNLQKFMEALQENGISAAIGREEDMSDSDSGGFSININSPKEAVIKTSAKRTVVLGADEVTAAKIYGAFSRACNGI